MRAHFVVPMTQKRSIYSTAGASTVRKFSIISNEDEHH